MFLQGQMRRKPEKIKWNICELCGCIFYEAAGNGKAGAAMGYVLARVACPVFVRNLCLTPIGTVRLIRLPKKEAMT